MKRVLIVDDEEDILLGLSRYLKRHGYDVITETSPRKAIEILSTEPADILITDVKMDEFSGLDLIEEAKRRNRDIRVIVMTARGSDELERLAIERGAVEYIEKPFDIDYLLQLLRKLEKGGFRGVVKELSITDMLNILNVEKANAVINISSTAGPGRIYMQDGEIVHARFGDLEGLDALKVIFSLEGGTFSVDKGVKPPKKTIDISFNNLMLEIFAQIDEESTGLSMESEAEESYDFGGSIFAGIIQEEEQEQVASSEEQKAEVSADAEGPRMKPLAEPIAEIIGEILSSDERMEAIEVYDMQENLLYGLGLFYPLARGLISTGGVTSGYIELENDRLLFFELKDGFLVLLALVNVSISLARVEYSRVLKRIFELLKEVE